MSAGLMVASTALVVLAGEVATNAFFCATSQPLACTSLTCSAAVTSDRNRSRSVPSSSTSGFSAWRPCRRPVRFPPCCGLRKSNLPSLTAIS